MSKNKILWGIIAIYIVAFIALVYYYEGNTFKSSSNNSTFNKESWTIHKIDEIKTFCDKYIYNTGEGWVAWWTSDGYLRFMKSTDSIPIILHSPNSKEQCQSVYCVNTNSYTELFWVDDVLPTPDSVAFILFYPNSPEFFEMNETRYRLLTFPSLNLVKVSWYDFQTSPDLVSITVVHELTEYKESKWGSYQLVYWITQNYNTKGQFVSNDSIASLFIYESDFWFNLVDVPLEKLDNSYYKKALVHIFDSFLKHLGTRKYQGGQARRRCIENIQRLNNFDSIWNGIDAQNYAIWETTKELSDELDDTVDELENSLETISFDEIFDDFFDETDILEELLE